MAEAARRARRWRCGAGRRWTTSPTSRSRRRRSGGWRSCGWRRSSSRSSRTSRRAGTARSSGELEALVAAEPLRERLHAQRMLALYRCGRQAEALAAYRQARATLVEAIGVEPGAELRRLHEAILRQDPSLEPAPAVELPPELDAETPLVGRDADLEWLRELWRGAHGAGRRLVLVTGARGIGKTRLAAELAGEVHRDRGAVLYASGAARRMRVGRWRGGRARGRRCSCSTTSTAPAKRCSRRSTSSPAAGRAAGARAGDRRGCALAGPTRRCAWRRSTPTRSARWPSSTRPRARRTPRRRAAAPGERRDPQRVHRLAAEWARAAAARRRDASASRAAAERAACARPRTSWPATWCELQALRERAEPRDVAAPGRLPVQGPGVVRRRGRRVLLRPRAARGRDGRAPRRRAADGHRRAVGQRQVLGAARRAAAALAAGVLPGSERWALALLRPGEHPLRALERATADARRAAARW